MFASVCVCVCMSIDPTLSIQSERSLSVASFLFSAEIFYPMQSADLFGYGLNCSSVTV